MDWGNKYVTSRLCSSGNDGVQWKHSISQERTDYCSCQQMPLPVNNVEGKQQLNDQTHYSSRQIKATRDSDVIFKMCVRICRGKSVIVSIFVWAHILCVCEGCQPEQSTSIQVSWIIETWLPHPLDFPSHFSFIPHFFIPSFSSSFEDFIPP